MMAVHLPRFADHIEAEPVSERVASLTDAESHQVLQYLAGFSPDTVGMAISDIKALQPRRREAES